MMEPRRYECRGRMRGKDAGTAGIDSDTGATEDAASRRQRQSGGSGLHCETAS